MQGGIYLGVLPVVIQSAFERVNGECHFNLFRKIVPHINNSDAKTVRTNIESGLFFVQLFWVSSG